MSRRIVQIAATPETKNERSCLFVLTEDGEVFYLASPDTDDAPSDWASLPPLPDVEE